MRLVRLFSGGKLPDRNDIVAARYGTVTAFQSASLAVPPFHGEAVVILTSEQMPAVRIHLQPKVTVAYRRDLRHEVDAALQAGSQRVIVDCSSWADLDLILLSALMDCAKQCDEQGAGFELENLRSDLRSRIGMLRLDGHLRLEPSRAP